VIDEAFDGVGRGGAIEIQCIPYIAQCAAGGFITRNHGEPVVQALHTLTDLDSDNEVVMAYEVTIDSLDHFLDEVLDLAAIKAAVGSRGTKDRAG
jgi:hypothetical protein